MNQHDKELKELEHIMDMHLPSILELVEMYLPYKDVKVFEKRMDAIYHTIIKLEKEFNR